jgi:excinuclease ABC subunit C
MNLSEKLNKLPSKPGVYFFKNQQGKVIYIGKSVNLKNRVKSYFQNKSLPFYTQQMVTKISDIDFITFFSEFEALLNEAKLINKYKPFYNIQFKDDKSFLSIAISREDWPRIYTTRKRNDKKTSYYGPFTSAGEVKRVLSFIRKIFPFRTCKKIPKKTCLYYHLKLCPGCCVGTDSKEYKKTIKKIIRLLAGDAQGLLKQMDLEMKKASRAKNFEKAAVLKKQLNDLTYVILNWQSLDKDSFKIVLPEDEKNKIKEQARTIFFKLKFLNRIEGYDISNFYGKDATGSMVVFENLKPVKDQYRRFKIRKADFADDVGMMHEIIKRRFSHTDWPFPDLLAVDGGKGQVNAALAVIRELKLKKKIYVLGLTKKQEIIIKPIIKENTVLKWQEIKLDKNNLFLRILQNLRDESHRFAKKYHLWLRKGKYRK